MFNSTSNFFTTPQILDLFFDTRLNSFAIPKIQLLLNTNTSEYAHNVFELSTLVDFLITSNSTSVLKLGLLELPNMEKTSINLINQNLLNEMHYLTAPKNEVYSMISILPEHQDTIEIFEVIS